MKKNNRFSLKKYILLQVTFLFIISTLLVSVYSFYRNKSALADFSYQYIDKYAASITNQIEKRFSQAAIASDFISLFSKRLIIDDNQYNLGLFDLENSPLLDSQNQDHIFLKKLLESFGALSAIYFSNENGDLIQIRQVKDYDKPQLEENKSLPRNTNYALRIININNNIPKERWVYYSMNNAIVMDEYIYPSTYNPTKRPWFTKASANESYISDIYYFGTIKNLVQTTSQLTKNNNNETISVNGVDLDIREISLFLRDIKLSKNAIFYILDGNDEVIASSDFKLPMILTGDKAKISQIKDFEKTPLWSGLEHNKKNKMNQFSMLYDKVDYVVGFSSFSDAFLKKMNSRWELVILLPTEDLFSVFMDAQNDSFGLYILIFLIIIINIILLSRRISDPIEELTDDANEIRKFNFSRESNFSSKLSEIIDLNEALKAMKHSLNSFSKYMPKRLVMRLLEKGEKIELGGDTKKLTVFFSDIEGFSTISEKLSAQELMEHISEYFNNLTTIIINNNGTIDKYIGDSVMAFWGAPDEDENKNYNACKSALEIQYYLLELNKKWRLEGRPELKTRIGLHSGEVVVGNMGSSDRMNYTIIGDNVNIASRLEGVNKFYDTFTIVSESIHEEMANQFLMRPLDIVAVKGKTKGVRIFELLGEFDGPDHIKPQKKHIEFVRVFDKAFEFYLHQNFDKALSILKELKKDNLFEKSVQTFIDRCEYYKKNPPPDNWDGTYQLSSKG